MKLKITEKGVYGPQNKPIPKGAVIEMDEGKIPGFLVGKCVKSDADEKLTELFVATPSAGVGTEIDEIPGGLADDGAADREALLAAAVKGLSPDEFTAAGLPKVGKVNAQVEDDEKFSAEEIAALWDAIKPQE